MLIFDLSGVPLDGKSAPGTELFSRLEARLFALRTLSSLTLRAEARTKELIILTARPLYAIVRFDAH